MPHRCDIILDPPNIRHHRRIRACGLRARLLGWHDVRRERRDEVGEARVRERPVVVVLDLVQDREEACLRVAGEGGGGEWGIVDVVGREGEGGDEVLAAVDGGREAVGEGDTVGVKVKSGSKEDRGRDVRTGRRPLCERSRPCPRGLGPVRT